jgi:putative cell wall-binding protein
VAVSTAALLAGGPMASVGTAAPVNDDFADATVFSLTDASPLTGSNAGATVEPNEPRHQYIDPRDTEASVWWRFTPVTDGAVSFTTSGSTFPAVLAIYMGETLWDLEGGEVYRMGTGTFPVTVSAGVTYHVVVASYEGDSTGSIVLGFTWQAFGDGTVAIESPVGVPAESMDFGSVGVGSSATRTFYVRNSGAGPLTVSSAEVTARSFASGEYRIVSDTASGAVIPPGQFREIVVAFEPAHGSSGPPDAVQYVGSLPGQASGSYWTLYDPGTGLVGAYVVWTYALNTGGSGPAAYTITSSSGGAIRDVESGTVDLVGGDAYEVEVGVDVSGFAPESRLDVVLPTEFSATKIFQPTSGTQVPAFTEILGVSFERLADAVLVIASDDSTATFGGASGSGVYLYGQGVGGGTGSSDVQRWSGEDRYATAAAVSAATFPQGATLAFVATGANFPDALAGGPAGGVTGGPILLTGRDSVPTATLTELARLGPQTIIVLGGPAVVSDAVIGQLTPFGSVQRWSGEDRYATAAAVSAATFPQGATVAFVATGANFPDALAGGPAGGVTGGPILLTGRDSVPTATLTELARLGPQTIIVLGGPAVVSDAVIGQLTPFGSVQRWSGEDRYATAAAVSAAAFPQGATVAFVATGANFPDALAGGPAGGVTGGPILLTGRDSVPTATLTELARLGPQTIVILGGPSAVSDSVLNQLAAFAP